MRSAVMDVRQMLARKGSRVITVEGSQTVREAAEVMAVNRVGSVIVTRGAELVGILTERDFVHQVALADRDPATTTVEAVMNASFIFVSPSDTLETCMELMTEHRCRHLPVTMGDSLIGLVSIGDCVAYLCDAALSENSQLWEYIAGRYPG
jgi:CBS domain-containing protein